MGNMQRAIGLAALSLFVLLSNPACRLIGGNSKPSGSTTQPSTNNPTQGGKAGTLTLLGSDPPTLDPATASDNLSSVYVVEIFGGLVTLDKDLKVQPDLAEKWDVSPDGKTYTFTLRKDAKFHDGKQVKASDFKYSIERTSNPRTLSPTADTYLADIVGVKEMLANKAQNVSGVKVVDDTTLQITIDEPKAYFISKLTYPTAFVVDKDNVEKGGRTWTDKPNGTGAFKLREWRKGQSIILDRNDNYHLGAPKLKTANYILSGGSSMTMYENDEIDVAPFGTTDSDRILDKNNSLYKEVVKDKDGTPGISELSVFYLGFNTKKAPFDDVKIRQAMNYAIDKDKIISVVLKSLDTRADGILPPGMPGYNPNLKGYKYDPDAAKKLVAGSKYPDLSKYDLTLTVPGAGANPPRTTQAIVEMWKTNLGIDIKIEQVEWATFLDDQHAKKYTLFDGSGWIADYPDPQNFLDVLFHSGSETNSTGYSSAKVDDLLQKARVEKNESARIDLYRQAEQAIMDDAPVVPQYFSKTFYVVKPYVEGYVVPSMVIPVLRYVSVNK